MKRSLFISFIALLLLTACGRGADIICTKEFNRDVNVKTTYYFYFTDGKTTSSDLIEIFEKQEDADETCEEYKEAMNKNKDYFKDSKLDCNGKKVEARNVPISKKNATKENIVKELEEEGFTCK